MSSRPPDAIREQIPRLTQVDGILSQRQIRLRGLDLIQNCTIRLHVSAARCFSREKGTDLGIKDLSEGY